MRPDDWIRWGVERLNYKSVLWRRLAYLGSRFGPRPLVEYSPACFGLMFAAMLPRVRRTVRANLRQLFGERSPWVEQRDIGRTFTCFAHCLAESLGAERADAQSTRCHIGDRELVDRVLRSGEGFILGTAHTGGWDVAAQHLLKETSRRLILVMERESDVRAQAVQDSLRTKWGIEVVRVGTDALEGLALLRHLRNGGVVAVQLDRLPKGGRSVPVRLGHGPFSLPLGPFLLSSLAQVPILPLFVARRGYYEYEIDVRGVTRLPRHSRQEDFAQAAQEVARQLETFLLANPEQWFNFGSEHAWPPNQGQTDGADPSANCHHRGLFQP